MGLLRRLAAWLGLAPSRRVRVRCRDCGRERDYRESGAPGRRVLVCERCGVLNAFTV